MQKLRLLSRDRLNVVYSIAIYMFASAGMSIYNKMALRALPLPFVLLALQMLFTVATIAAAWNQVHIGSQRDMLRWTQVSATFTAVLTSGMIAMKLNTLGTVVMFRNISPFFTLAIEASLFAHPITLNVPTVVSLATILFGVVLFETGDLALNFWGLMALVVNMAVSVVDRTLQRHLLSNNAVDISKPGMMLINNTCGLVFAIAAGTVMGEPWRVGEIASTIDSSGFLFIALSCVVGVLIGYAGLRLQSLIPATTFTVITNLNKFVVILFGAVFLSESLTALSFAGCIISIGGGAWYAYERERAAAGERRDRDEEKASTT